jgi:hypothetical protein
LRLGTGQVKEELKEGNAPHFFSGLEPWMPAGSS